MLPDFHGCTELAINKGYCVTAITGHEQEVTDTEFLRNGAGAILKDENGYAWSWWKMRPYMIQIPYFEYVELKKWIIRQCKTTGQCDQAVSSWDRTLENLDQKVLTK